MAKQLAAGRIITKLDQDALAMYCTAYVRWMEANKMISEQGYLTESPNGYLMPSPWLAISNKCFDQMRAIMVEFGMTPSSRTKVKALPDKPNNADPWGEF